jgi:four helix bundle protein
MAKFERFEDIIAWQRARQLVAAIYATSSNGHFNKDFGLKDQIRRASVSVMLNIAEGFARRGDKQFGQFLHVAQGSVAEVQSALYIALDQNYVDRNGFDRLYGQCTEISKMLSGLITYLRRK